VDASAILQRVIGTRLASVTFSGRLGRVAVDIDCFVQQMNLYTRTLDVCSMIWGEAAQTVRIITAPKRCRDARLLSRADRGV
jgi:hypothetical protein